MSNTEMSRGDKIRRIIDELEMALDDAKDARDAWNEGLRGDDIPSMKFHAEEAARLIREWGLA